MGLRSWQPRGHTRCRSHQCVGLTNVSGTEEPSSQVTLRIILNEDEMVMGMELEIKRSFIEGKQTPFARDVTKSFLWAACPAVDRGKIDLLCHEISTRHEGTNLKPLTVRRRPRLPSTPSEAYLVFAGSSSELELIMKAAKLQMVNEQENA